MEQGPAQKYRDDIRVALADLLADRPEVVARGMFGHPGFAVGGKMVATLYDDGVAVKLPAAQVPAALMRPEVSPFRPYGRTMREWVFIQRTDPAGYAADLDLFEMAIAYAGSLVATAGPSGVRRERRKPSVQ